MAFWTNNAMEPKRSYRFIFELTGQGDEDVLASYFVKSASKPNFQMDSTLEVKYVQHTFYYPGRVKWQPITVTVVDPGTPDAAGILANILVQSGYTLPNTAIDSSNSISKIDANNAMRNPKLRQIDQDGKTIESWTLWNAFLTQVNFGNVSYDEDSIVNYELTIAYDYASLSTKGTKVLPGMKRDG